MPAPAEALPPVLSWPEIEASCRIPVGFLMFKSAGWLVFAGLLALLNASQLITPDLLAHCPWMTYGRVHPAATNAFIYGFAFQAALGVALWLICRLGRSLLVNPILILVASMFWNLGVLVGVLGILAGENTGYEGFEMPAYATQILGVAYLLIAIWALMTFHFRRDREMFVSQWYIVAALFWFPWIYAVAETFLIYHPVRGVLQSVVAWWYSNNVVTLFLTPMALATLYYFRPVFSGEPVYSKDLSLLGFWTLLLFGGWAGIPSGAPLPAWIITVSIGGTVMLAIPTLAVAVNLWMTGCSATPKSGGIAAKFMFLGTIAFVVSSVLMIVSSLRSVAVLTRFSYVTPAISHLLLYGFIAMVLFGAIYHILPRLIQQEWSDKLTQAHYWGSLIGTVLFVASMFMAGIREGLDLLDSQIEVVDIAFQTLSSLGVARIGVALILTGNLCFLANMLLMAFRCCRTCCKMCCGTTPAEGGAR